MRSSGIRWAILAWVMVVCVGAGCARKDDVENQANKTEPPPAVPQPTQPIPNDKEPIVGKTGGAPTEMGACAQHWDPSALWGYLSNAYSYGGYQPFSYNDPNLPGPRGLKSRGARGLSCANSLMQWASLLGQNQGYYAPGALQGYLWQLLNWGYRNPYYGAYGGNYEWPD